MSLGKFLTINEIFHSIQGESYLAGLPFVFVRLTGCHQRCVYCDTEYAFYEGKKMTIGEILEKVESYASKNVLLTGGEPLLQGNCGLLAEELLKRGYRVSVETSGNRDVRQVPRDVIKIMDLKTPGSLEMELNTYENLNYLEAKDEVKFCVTNEADLVWSLDQIRERKLYNLCHVSISPTAEGLLPKIADAVLASGLPIRVQTQLHKIIWPAKDRGF
jgi:7-carboxy-7-deazaguanine synthase